MLGTFFPCQCSTFPKCDFSQCQGTASGLDRQQFVFLFPTDHFSRLFISSHQTPQRPLNLVRLSNRIFLTKIFSVVFNYSRLCCVWFHHKQLAQLISFCVGGIEVPPDLSCRQATAFSLLEPLCRGFVWFCLFRATPSVQPPPPRLGVKSKL